MLLLLLLLLCVRAVEEMVRSNPKAVEIKDDEGCVALHIAVGRNRTEIFTFLLQQVCEEETAVFQK